MNEKGNLMIESNRNKPERLDWRFIYNQNFIDEKDEDLSSDSVPELAIDYSFYNKLRKLEKIAIIVQYQFAYLSTLGGAYHLCNQPKTALVIAKKQELLGRFLGSTQIVIRALVFQAINLYLLGRSAQSQKLFRKIKIHEGYYSMDDLKRFVDACEMWVKRNLIDKVDIRQT